MSRLRRGDDWRLFSEKPNPRLNSETPLCYGFVYEEALYIIAVETSSRVSTERFNDVTGSSVAPKTILAVINDVQVSN